MPDLRFVVYGAGAIGGVIGGRLFQHGYPVVLVARGAHYEELARSGLRLEDPDGHAVLDVAVVDHPGRVRWEPGDVVVLATKTQHSPQALHALAEVAPPEVPVVCAQNGVDNERQAIRYFEAVYGMCVMCPATHLHPGIVQASSAPTTGILDTGRYPRGTDATSDAVTSALRVSTFSAESVPDVMRWKYAKLIMNLGNAVDAACGPAGAAGDVVRRARHEGVEVLRAAGIDFASRQEDLARRGDLLQLRTVGNESRAGGSSWQSLARRTGSIEADYLNGEIVLLGRQYGVPTPVNAMLQRLARDMARRHVAPGSLPADELLSRLPG